MPAPTKNPVGDGVYNVPSLCHSFRMTFYIHQIYYQVVGKAVARPPRLGNIIRMALCCLLCRRELRFHARYILRIRYAPSVHDIFASQMQTRSAGTYRNARHYIAFIYRVRSTYRLPSGKSGRRAYLRYDYRRDIFSAERSKSEGNTLCINEHF